MNRDPGAATLGVLSPGLSAGAGGASVVVDAGVVVAVDGCARVCGAAAVVLEVGGDETDDDRDGGAGEE